MANRTPTDTGTETPVVTVVAGSPTPEELAAIVTVLTAAATPSVGQLPDRPLIGGWESHARTLRRPIQPGPGAWAYYLR